MSATLRAASSFTAEHLRARLTLVLLVAIPAIFVVAAANVLGEFAGALGGALDGRAASALGAGWAAAFIAGALGFFQVSSARAADRRFVLAGFGVLRVVTARIASSIVLAVVASVAGFVALIATTGVAHPWHALVAIFAFALIYLGVGAIVGSLIRAPLEGSMAVAFIFLLDVFSGPGMTDSRSQIFNVSREAADVLIDAAVGKATTTRDWLAMIASVAIALAAAYATFALTARSRR